MSDIATLSAGSKSPQIRKPTLPICSDFAADMNAPAQIYYSSFIELAKSNISFKNP